MLNISSLFIVPDTMTTFSSISVAMVGAQGNDAYGNPSKRKISYLLGRAILAFGVFFIVTD